jgi:hypothetical protein
MLLSRYPRLNSGAQGVLIRTALGAMMGLLAALVRHLMDIAGAPPSLLPWAIGFPAMLIAGIMAGRIAGITSMLVAGIATWFFVIEPETLNTNSAIVSMSGYLVIGILILVIVEAFRMSELKRAREHAQYLEQAARQQEIITQELNHRLKNVLAMVQAVACQTFVNSDMEALEVFTSRIQAIASAQTVFTGDHTKRSRSPSGCPAALKPFKGNISFEGELHGRGQTGFVARSRAARTGHQRGQVWRAQHARRRSDRDCDQTQRRRFPPILVRTEGDRACEPEQQGLRQQAAQASPRNIEFRPEGLIARFPIFAASPRLRNKHIDRHLGFGYK